MGNVDVVCKLGNVCGRRKRQSRNANGMKTRFECLLLIYGVETLLLGCWRKQIILISTNILRVTLQKEHPCVCHFFRLKVKGKYVRSIRL